jgi:hypothetical protein
MRDPINAKKQFHNTIDGSERGGHNRGSSESESRLHEARLIRDFLHVPQRKNKGQ